MARQASRLVMRDINETAQGFTTDLLASHHSRRTRLENSGEHPAGAESYTSSPTPSSSACASASSARAADP